MTGECKKEVVEKDTELNNDAWEDTAYYVTVVEDHMGDLARLKNMWGEVWGLSLIHI